MDFNEILNNVVAGLICTASVTIFTLIYKILKKQYLKDKMLFSLKALFYSGIFNLIISCIFFDIENLFLDFFSSSNISNLVFLLSIVVNLKNVIMVYKNTEKYIKDSTNSNQNS